MTQAAIFPTVTFDEFIAWYPENSENRYELHRGVIVEMPKPKGKHSEIAGFLGLEIGRQCRHRQLPYFVPRECVVRSLSAESGYEPDIIVLDRQEVSKEPRWEAESIITMGSSVRLIVEVVSTNWRVDYMTKAADYEEMGISEYWVIDYLGLGGRRFIGNPKQPTISVYQLIDGEYEISQFRGNNPIESPAFPELNLTAEQIFA
ncbi:MAG TPA: Uma2 family endonuclease [Oscillatoriaceae cyanobacterium M33_DOE_052]|uniref:Uma2 family endonuclease n=1 Tax=Planktothricoides sp. SpSt-374 TaxID=2282167 RepID=A0A7C3ZN55_9CYAN|nr:Uma2 family endonuclease [Oscillatoriaceae cyanobacterium M33_DOE_052]